MHDYAYKQELGVSEPHIPGFQAVQHKLQSKLNSTGDQDTPSANRNNITVTMAFNLEYIDSFQTIWNRKCTYSVTNIPQAAIYS